MKGRPRAVDAAHLDGGGGVTSANVFCLALLPVLLSLVARALGTVGLHMAGYGAVMATLACFLCRHDKSRARTGGWRAPEKTLHLFELIGGWPGAFLAQRHRRRKCSKAGFQAVSWCVEMAYPFAAFDCLQDWKITRRAAKEGRAIMGDPRG